MKCPQCGFENRPGARFCKECGYPLPVQEEAPVMPQEPQRTICPFCGAAAKPNARFCPQCGNLLSAEPSPLPSPSPAEISTKPSMSARPQPQTGQQPGGYAQPPYQPPPPSAEPPAPEEGLPRWMIWVGAAVAFLCIIALVLGGIKFGPDLLGGKEDPTAAPTPTVAPPTAPPATEAATAPEPTATSAPTAEPVPAFDAQVSIAALTDTVHVGDSITVTITFTNSGGVPLSNLRYQLVGEWAPYLELATTEPLKHEVEVPPQASDTATIELRAIQVGEAALQGYVLADLHTAPLSQGSCLSDDVMVVGVVGE